MSLATTTWSSPRKNMNLVPAIFTPVEEKLGQPEAMAVISCKAFFEKKQIQSKYWWGQIELGLREEGTGRESRKRTYGSGDVPARRGSPDRAVGANNGGLHIALQASGELEVRLEARETPPEAHTQSHFRTYLLNVAGGNEVGDVIVPRHAK